MNPPKMHHPVETYVNLVERDIQSLTKTFKARQIHFHNNMSQEERNALKSLMDDPSLIIKPADKGGSVVIMDKKDYVQEIKSQLSNTAVYEKLNGDLVFDISKKLLNIINRYLELKIIDEKMANFLLKKHPITPILYTLPKVHKSLQCPPGRPIVALADSILAAPAIVLEKILTPLTKSAPSYLLDTSHFLHEIKSVSVESGDLLVTLDVCSLYTSIVHSKGIRAVEWLLNGTDYSDMQKKFFLELRCQK
ncbi:uncharacterized protein ACNLHF_021098 [Anomaloglossus baeobatrachus]